MKHDHLIVYRGNDKTIIRNPKYKGFFCGNNAKVEGMFSQMVFNPEKRVWNHLLAIMELQRAVQLFESVLCP